MQVTIVDVTARNVGDIPEACKPCLYWENPSIFRRVEELSPAERVGFEARKADWFRETQKKSGTCGKILYCEDTPVGYAQYSVVDSLPQAHEYGAKSLGKPEDDVAFISCLYISDELFRRRGLGQRLLGQVISDLKQRGFKAVETFARKKSSNNPSGPIELYLKQGFEVVEDVNPEFALVRLDLQGDGRNCC